MSERLTVTNAARVAGISPATVRQAIRDGRLRSERVSDPTGRFYHLIDREEIERYVRDRRTWKSKRAAHDS